MMETQNETISDILGDIKQMLNWDANERVYLKQIGNKYASMVENLTSESTSEESNSQNNEEDDN